MPLRKHFTISGVVQALREIKPPHLEVHETIMTMGMREENVCKDCISFQTIRNPLTPVPLDMRPVYTLLDFERAY